MKKIFSLLFLVAGGGITSLNAATFTSNTASGTWTTASSWTFSGIDVDGIPDADDDVTILSGHSITSSVSVQVRDLTVNGSITMNSANITIRGNYVMNGTEAGTGGFVFASGTGTLISGTGTFSSTAVYAFGSGSNRTISSEVTMVKTKLTYFTSTTMTNNGNLTLSALSQSGAITFTNGPTGVLTLRNPGFMSGKTFNAHAAGNTVNISYATGAIPLTTSGYYNLVLSGITTGTKTITTNTTISNNLTINALNTLNSNNFDISVGGNWVKNGTFTASAGRTVSFNGSSPQTLSGTGTTTFEQLTINNAAGVSINTGTYVLNDVLTITSGTFNTFGNSFTMISTATRTARIAPITGSGSIAGDFTIQRFLSSRTQSPLGAHWTDLASPVQNSTVADWDNELFFYYPHNPPGEYSNIVTFNESLGEYEGVSAASSLAPGLGFEIALTDDATLASFSNTTLTTIGTPNHGDQDLSSMISFNNIGENLVGNPFASSISWDAVLAASSGIMNFYDVYEADAGDYVSYGSGSEIGAGQGFWVYTTTSSATLMVPETAKTTATNSVIRSTIKQDYLTLNIRGSFEPASHAHLLKIAASDLATNGWDNNDHPFRKSRMKSAPSITSKIDGREAKINTFSSSNDSYSLPLFTKGSVNGTYTIEAAGLNNMEEYTCIVLEDTKEGKRIDLSATAVYSFEMNSNDSEERFIIHFSKDNSCKAMMTENVFNSFENNISILPTASGNSISFRFSENTPVTIEVVNVLGQSVVEPASVVASNQSYEVALPEGFSGMYLIKVSGEKNTLVKKYVRK
jgi:hypothetical protein